MQNFNGGLQPPQELPLSEGGVDGLPGDILVHARAAQAEVHGWSLVRFCLGDVEAEMETVLVESGKEGRHFRLQTFLGAQALCGQVLDKCGGRGGGGWDLEATLYS